MREPDMREPDDDALAELTKLANDIRARFADVESRTIESDLIMLGRRRDADVICKCITKPSITILSSGSKEADLAGRKVVFKKGTLLALAVDLPDTFVVKQTEDPDLTSISLVIREDMLQRALGGFSPQTVILRATPSSVLPPKRSCCACSRRPQAPCSGGSTIRRPSKTASAGR